MTQIDKECLPLESLESVLNWNPPSSSWSVYVIGKTQRSSFCNRGSSFTSLSHEALPTQSCPKTVFCHDMKGGYLEDKFVDGAENHDGFRFIHWSCIDTFIYFSHNFVTIPPLAWINSAHLHGVHVLGTIISEWKDGESMWKDVLGNYDKTVALSEKLCEICIHYNFDGYLLNIENEVGSEYVFALLDFISILRRSLMSLKSDAIVIWYDSVIIPAGTIKYQNKLNGFNRAFFDNCDGIYLNYNWTREDLMLSAKNAGNRLADVYVGVDVFGRGCYGGGGFNSNLAVIMAHLHSLSVALFAPGWVHETCPEEEEFESRNHKFWSLLHPLLYTRGPAFLPFSTTFCQGYGKKMYSRGIVSNYQE